MKTDKDIKKDVQDALKWEPQLQGCEIGVNAKNGVVTLTGIVDNYYKKREAEKAAKKIHGVRAIVEKIQVVPFDSDSINDNTIAEKILSAFKSTYSIPDNRITIKVENGWVVLEGQVLWNFQKENAEHTAAGIEGVYGITNKIQTKSEHKDQVKKNAIEKALNNNAALHEDHIEVAVKDGDVTLSGLVKSFFEKEEASRIAWNAPGIWSVTNELGVDSFS